MVNPTKLSTVCANVKASSKAMSVINHCTGCNSFAAVQTNDTKVVKLVCNKDPKAPVSLNADVVATCVSETMFTGARRN